LRQAAIRPNVITCTLAAQGSVRRHPDPDDHDTAGARGGRGAAGGVRVGRYEDLQRVGHAEVRAAAARGGAGRRLRRLGGGAGGGVPGAGVGRGGRHAGGRVRRRGQGGPGLRRPLLAS
jgi:hypothetical protein